jgi:chemotaxis protein CheD
MTQSTLMPTPLGKPADHVSVGIGQAVIAAEPARLTTILGSCVAVALYHPQYRVGVLSHVLLPHATGATAYPAKFADTAVPYMLSLLKEHGTHPGALVARFAGGACMFGDGKFMQIGDTNAQVIAHELDTAGIRIAGRDVGGKLGRRVCFELATGAFVVECLGQPAKTI